MGYVSGYWGDNPSVMVIQQRPLTARASVVRLEARWTTRPSPSFFLTLVQRHKRSGIKLTIGLVIYASITTSPHDQIAHCFVLYPPWSPLFLCQPVATIVSEVSNLHMG